MAEIHAPHDPVLDQAGSEILDVLKKYDIAGVAILHRPRAAKHVADLSPSWSCAKREGNSFRIKAHISDFPSKEAQSECVTNTVEMLIALGRKGEELSVGMASMVGAVAKQFNINSLITPIEDDDEPRIIRPPGYPQG